MASIVYAIVKVTTETNENVIETNFNYFQFIDFTIAIITSLMA